MNLGRNSMLNIDGCWVLSLTFDAAAALSDVEKRNSLSTLNGGAVQTALGVYERCVRFVHCQWEIVSRCSYEALLLMW